MNHDALDALAVENGIEWAEDVTTKADKVAALEAAGVSGPVVYRLKLKQEWFDEGVELVGAFMAGTRAVSLAGDEVFETDDRDIYVGLQGIPWLEGEVA